MRKNMYAIMLGVVAVGAAIWAVPLVWYAKQKKALKEAEEAKKSEEPKETEEPKEY